MGAELEQRSEQTNCILSFLSNRTNMVRLTISGQKALDDVVVRMALLLTDLFLK
jgi:hypothetical protein